MILIVMGKREAYTPQCLVNAYRDSVPELISPTDVDFLGEADDFIFGKIFVLARRYTAVDNLNLCEWSMRYHRLLHRAFRHIRVHAKVTKGARSSQYSHARQVKKRCFMALLSGCFVIPRRSMSQIRQTPSASMLMPKPTAWIR